MINRLMKIIAIKCST